MATPFFFLHIVLIGSGYYWLFCAELQACVHAAAAGVSAGEGYECTVTVDDEDSKIIVFDNWKQVSPASIVAARLRAAAHLLLICCSSAARLSCAFVAPAGASASPL